jgi:phosphatidylserine/phosphatidylglycerophosphate/cardiolipin synthase-like enzyme
MKDHLLNLSDADLAELGRALRARRLEPPFTPVALQRIAGPLATEVVAALDQLLGEGFTSEQIAIVTDLVSRSRGQRRIAEDLFDLVVTGPEAPGITSRDTSVVVREMFSKAEQSVVLAGYSVYQGQKVFQTLAERMAAKLDLKVRFFLDVGRGPGDTTAPELIVRRFADRFRLKQWPKGYRLPEVYYDPRSLISDAAQRACLHAKCIVTDWSQVFVSSANFTEAAQERNLEVGLLIHSTHLARQLNQFFETLLGNRLLVRIV